MSAQEMTPERLALRRLIAVEEAASNLSRSLHELHDVCPVCEEPEGEHYADCLSGALHEALSLPEPIQGGAYPDLLSHVDAITADRDEARQEVAALRAQRDEIREAHRVEVAALTARLEAAERERETNAERCFEALDDIAKLLVERNAAQARADAAEAKLAALAKLYKAWDLVARDGASFDNDLAAETFLKAALDAARGEP